MEEDDRPRPRPAMLVPPVLDRLGVEELTAYVALLRAEIGRVEGEISRKKDVRAAADSFFRT